MPFSSFCLVWFRLEAAQLPWGVRGAAAGLRPGGLGGAGGAPWGRVAVVSVGTTPASFDPVPSAPLAPAVGVHGRGRLEPTGPGATRVGLMLTKAPAGVAPGQRSAASCSVGICLSEISGLSGLPCPLPSDGQGAGDAAWILDLSLLPFRCCQDSGEMPGGV